MTPIHPPPQTQAKLELDALTAALCGGLRGTPSSNGSTPWKSRLAWARYALVQCTGTRECRLNVASQLYIRGITLARMIDSCAQEALIGLVYAQGCTRARRETERQVCRDSTRIRDSCLQGFDWHENCRGWRGEAVMKHHLILLPRQLGSRKC